LPKRLKYICLDTLIISSSVFKHLPYTLEEIDADSCEEEEFLLYRERFPNLKSTKIGADETRYY
jgi:hypothetical protein